ncbi:3-deoxy-D-manno-octulosonic acid kinase [Gilvimarinus agarilyticus]|uniref:3-deoxy-D-manno-octulosonic acid kinase n=1 Tax=unclassified Gilvimarinus TaxID=2642066 RepID=UPI001C095610|nr:MULTISPECIES: 3-deoxy-D-manno-octulosonic acid kinase [unclassified Gilvimarinus]MBU2886609.1 3-deoxy-D-manno-octulosonic acid kinase [Gilvimarinus agarilyticus]MDO6571277.1 3-deoxy-D-manno-octulosonic acid kinase [Gilvimarinus sp. 2_MG-2023]MDO6746348.1 3-deoxy-D-manno-octulosonic acid kinase [Gilvimarinus sp. 1_MG-2023]
MTKLSHRRIDSDHHHALVSTGTSTTIQLDSFEPRAWGQSAVSVSGSGRGSAWFVNTASGEQWVLRHYRRGGLPGKLIKDAFLYLGEPSVRSINEYKLLQTLYARQLPVPKPIAAHYCRTGLVYRAAIIVARLPGTRSLLTLNDKADRPLWEAAGQCIRQFHDAGVYHADLNATNVLVNPDSGQVYLIDFDRGALRTASPESTAWKRANLNRLQRGLVKHWPTNTGSSTPFFDALICGYR